jgi:hypothetical protein
MPNDEVKQGDLYDINPDDLEESFLDVAKTFFNIARNTITAYKTQLQVKKKLRKISAQVFINEKNRTDVKVTDNMAKELVVVDKEVSDCNDEYIEALSVYETYKSYKETVLLKKEMLVALGYNRKLEADLEKER